MKIERVEITAKPRQLKETWTVELQPPISVGTKMNWKERLRSIHIQLMNTDLTDDNTNKVMEVATCRMQHHFPGPYTVVENFDPARGVFGFKLKFEDPNEELLWMLKNS